MKFFFSLIPTADELAEIGTKAMLVIVAAVLAVYTPLIILAWEGLKWCLQ